MSSNLGGPLMQKGVPQELPHLMATPNALDFHKVGDNVFAPGTNDLADKNATNHSLDPLS
jgi:hypothetical protein